jgi:hypothetical protein
MWYRYAENLIPTFPLAEKIASYFSKELAQNDKIKEFRTLLVKLEANRREIAKAQDMNIRAKLQMIFHDLDSQLDATSEGVFDALLPLADEANRMIAESELFKGSDPPTLRFVILGNGVNGSYNPKQNIIAINAFSFIRGSIDYLRTLAHELTHAMQNKYDARKMLDSASRQNKNQTFNNENDREKYVRLYVNRQIERQAFLTNIIKELSYFGSPPKDYAGFKEFLNESDTWTNMSQDLYPENKISMMKSLYKYYSDRPSPALSSEAD